MNQLKAYGHCRGKTLTGIHRLDDFGKRVGVFFDDGSFIALEAGITEISEGRHAGHVSIAESDVKLDMDRLEFWEVV